MKTLAAIGRAAACSLSGGLLRGCPFQRRKATPHDGLPGVFGMGTLARGEYFAGHSFPALAAHARAIVDRLT
jgi:hypothetical protein